MAAWKPKASGFLFVSFCVVSRSAASLAQIAGDLAYHPQMAGPRSRAKFASNTEPQTSSELGAPAASVLRQFRLLFNSIKTHFQLVEKKAGIGGAQIWALSVIRDRPGIGVNDLADAMDIHQSTASNLVRALVGRGLISACREAVDRREVQLTIRTAGRDVLRRAPGPFAGILPDALASLDKRTLARLHADLSTLIGALRADERAAREPLGQLWGKKKAPAKSPRRRPGV